MIFGMFNIKKECRNIKLLRANHNRWGSFLLFLIVIRNHHADLKLVTEVFLEILGNGLILRISYFQT